jgi:methyl-accepting chemotaxis protein
LPIRPLKTGLSLVSLLTLLFFAINSLITLSTSPWVLLTISVLGFLAGAGVFLIPEKKVKLQQEISQKFDVTYEELQQSKASVLNTEDAGRRLASAVANTIAFISQISHRALEVSNDAQGMSLQVTEGAAAMEEILAVVTSIADQISLQGTKVNQSASAIEEMTASINSVNAIVQKRSETAQSLLGVTKEGSEYQVTTGQMMDDVNKSVKAVHELLEVINEIAARTNLLAMNAAIEAAHAGEKGRGFAVVASEIRKLAESTSKNSSSIGKTLGELVKKIDRAQEASRNSSRAFDDIKNGVDSMVQSFMEISTSTRELDAGTQDMLGSVNELSEISHHLKDGAGEMKFAAQEVTTSLVDTGERAKHTASSIREISNLTIDLTTSSEQISELNLRINSYVRESLHNLFLDAEDDLQASVALERLHISNLILGHLIWVSRSRGILSGHKNMDVSTLLDHKNCDLGKWLETEGREKIGDQKTYDRLSLIHEELHTILRNIVECGEQGVCTDQEEEYIELLKYSKEIVEILSSLHMDDSVRWSEDLKVDVPIFDRHHQSLLGLVDKLYQALKTDKTHESLMGIFDELLHYTSYHFGAEEAAFEEFGYPDCDSHKDLHKALVLKALELREDLQHGKPMVAVEVMEFLRDWVTQHIKGCDRLYSAFFSDKAVEEFLDRRKEFMVAKGLEEV